MAKDRVTEVNEKKCRWCGRVGTRAFVSQHPDGPVWMGPWRCQWGGPCDRRREAADLAERARQAAELSPAGELVPAEPVDLDAMTEEG